MNIPALVSAGVLLIGVFLPWVSVMGFSVNAFAGWEGKLLALAALASGVLVGLKMKWAVISAVTAVLIVLYLTFQFLSEGMFSFLGIGYYISLIASIALVATSFKLWTEGGTDFSDAVDDFKEDWNNDENAG